MRLSDEALTTGIATLVASSRTMTALFLRYLAEIETRGLHREAACSSLFVFCRDRLGLSEGEAFRRIVGARLGRRFPIIFEWVESGRIHLSALTLLRERLHDDDHLELLEAAAGKTKRQVEELLAVRFPRPDVPARIRKLPARIGERMRAGALERADYTLPARRHGATMAGVDRGVGQGTAGSGAVDVRPAADAASESAATTVPASDTHEAPRHGRAERPSDLAGHGSAGPPSDGHGRAGAPSEALECGPRVVGKRAPAGRAETPWEARGRIEPLSETRYRVEFTATAAARDALLRARDLMRHANPSGDLAVVVERALELLVADLEKKRLGKTRRPRGATTREVATMGRSVEAHAEAHGEARAEARVEARAEAVSAAPAPTGAAPPCAKARAPVAPAPDASGRAARAGRRAEHVSAAVRREVFARDGERCSFVDAEGRRCEERGWLQLDHAEPRGAGGHSGADNVRVRCRAHNLHAAEQTFGRERVRARIHLRQQKCRAD